MSVTAKIAAVNTTEDTGITPKVAQDFYTHLDTSRVAIVEFTSVEHSIDIEGHRTVKLKIGFIEPADGEIEDLLRSLAQALYRNRKPQKAIDGIEADEATPEDIAAQMQAHLHEMGIDDVEVEFTPAGGQ